MGLCRLAPARASPHAGAEPACRDRRSRPAGREVRDCLIMGVEQASFRQQRVHERVADRGLSTVLRNCARGRRTACAHLAPFALSARSPFSTFLSSMVTSTRSMSDLAHTWSCERLPQEDHRQHRAVLLHLLDERPRAFPQISSGSVPSSCCTTAVVIRSFAIRQPEQKARTFYSTCYSGVLSTQAARKCRAEVVLPSRNECRYRRHPVERLRACRGRPRSRLAR